MKMKFILSILFVLSFTVMNFAQNDWKLDYDEALATAKTEKKPVLILFTGSDWCPPCKRLHSAIFHNKQFEDWAKDNLIMVLADFPRRKENQLPVEQKVKNNNLAKKFGIRGFPTVLILNTYGKVLDKKVGYGGESPKEYIQNIVSKTKNLH